MVLRISIGVFIVVSMLNLLFSCNNGLSVETMQYATIGQKLYITHCQNCHGNKGEGLGRLYPGLTDTTYLTKNRNKLACFVRKGMNEKILIHGIEYNQQMPAFPNLSSLDIAYVLTYVTTYFGNSKTHFKQAEIEEFLKNCK